MSHRRPGRPNRQYNIRVRSVRRDPINFEGLARAALEQAAMDERRRANHEPPRRQCQHRKQPNATHRRKEPHYDDLE